MELHVGVSNPTFLYNSVYRHLSTGIVYLFARFWANMATTLLNTLTFALGAVVIYVAKRLLQNKNNRFQLPPGPKGLPILGNINDMPKAGELEATHWLKHKDLYGMSDTPCTLLR